MRLGLARGPVELEKILAFDPMAKHRVAPKPQTGVVTVAKGQKPLTPKQWLTSGDNEELVI
jgi:hypothetical protein